MNGWTFSQSFRKRGKVTTTIIAEMRILGPDETFRSEQELLVRLIIGYFNTILKFQNLKENTH